MTHIKFNLVGGGSLFIPRSTPLAVRSPDADHNDMYKTEVGGLPYCLVRPASEAYWMAVFGDCHEIIAKIQQVEASSGA